MKKQVKKSIAAFRQLPVLSTQQQKQLKGGNDSVEDRVNNPSGFIGDDDILGG